MSHSKMIIENLTDHIRSQFEKFNASERGVAVIEFALIMPFMLLLYFGTVEGSRALAYDRRLNSAAAALGDLVARTKSSLTTAELNDYFLASRITMTPYDPDALQQVVTCVYVDEDGNSTVIWSQGNNGGTAHTVSANYDLPEAMTDIASESYVIVSEAEMDYNPLTDLIFESTINLYKEQFYIPRFGELIALDTS